LGRVKNAEGKSKRHGRGTRSRGRRRWQSLIVKTSRFELFSVQCGLKG
jgi:hypothetical protein